MPRVSDWLPFRCGDHVNAKCDPRHVGRVEAVRHGAVAVVRWPNGWVGEFSLSELERSPHDAI